nr:unnamed protein product [Callosobruchus chinensis]
MIILILSIFITKVSWISGCTVAYTTNIHIKKIQQTNLEPETISPFGKQVTHQTDKAGKFIIWTFSPFFQTLTVLSSSEVTKPSSPNALHLAILKKLRDLNWILF